MYVLNERGLEQNFIHMATPLSLPAYFMSYSPELIRSYRYKFGFVECVVCCKFIIIYIITTGRFFCCCWNHLGTLKIKVMKIWDLLFDLLDFIASDTFHLWCAYQSDHLPQFSHNPCTCSACTHQYLYNTSNFCCPKFLATRINNIQSPIILGTSWMALNIGNYKITTSVYIW